MEPSFLAQFPHMVFLRKGIHKTPLCVIHFTLFIGSAAFSASPPALYAIDLKSNSQRPMHGHMTNYAFFFSQPCPHEDTDPCFHAVIGTRDGCLSF